jgi:hypothetical protein
MRAKTRTAKKRYFSVSFDYVVDETHGLTDDLSKPWPTVEHKPERFQGDVRVAAKDAFEAAGLFEEALTRLLTQEAKRRSKPRKRA